MAPDGGHSPVESVHCGREGEASTGRNAAAEAPEVSGEEFLWLVVVLTIIRIGGYNSNNSG